MDQIPFKLSKEKTNRTRRGRGPGSGLGKTAGRGHKGQKSRTGSSRKFYFEGGQMPLVRKLPKHGFNNHRFRREYSVLNVADIAKAFPEGSDVGPKDFLKAGLINRILDGGVKVLAKGELSHKLTVHAHKFSGAATEKIQATGGKAVVIERPNQSQDK